MSLKLHSACFDRTNDRRNILITFIALVTLLQDFGAIQAENHLDDINVDDDISEGGDDDDDNRSQASLSLLSESSMRVQLRLFRKKAIQRRREGGAYSIGSKIGKLNRRADVEDEPSGRRTPSDTSAPPCLDSLRAISVTGGASDSFAELEDCDNEDPTKSITLNANASMISDLDTGTIDTTDCGVLHRYGIKPIGSSVPNMDDFLDAPTPKTQNNGPTSIATFMDDLYLPSVSIESAETGVVRWRQFSKTEMKAKIARKLTFRGDDEEDHLIKQDQPENCTGPSGPEGRGKCVLDDPDQLATPTQDPDKPKKPKIKVRYIQCGPIRTCSMTFRENHCFPSLMILAPLFCHTFHFQDVRSGDFNNVERSIFQSIDKADLQRQRQS
jgi:hypothetical protein